MRRRKNRAGRRESPDQEPARPQAASHSPVPFSHFSVFVNEEKKKYIGRDISDNAREYMPLSVLREYWTPAKISRVQNAFPRPLSFNIDTIRSRYLRTFSTLVFSERIASLEDFTSQNLSDERLPLGRHPEEWPKDPYYQKLFSDISEHQWLFFPLVFTPNQLEDRRLDDKRVLPIDSLEEIRHGDAALVQKMVIHDSCNNLVGKDKKGVPNQRVFVLKTYLKPKFEKLYDNEVRALRMLKNSPSPNVITYYGAFRQYNTYNLILEYADGGTLSSFFEKMPPPKGADIVRFWKSVAEVLKGLDRVHRLMMVVDDQSVNGIHEDIKPENILLFKRSASPYDFTPKVADFGLFSHVRESKTNSCEAMGLHNHGNQRYSSPECSHNAIYKQEAPNLINTRADIFSLGAVLSDTCAWIVGGRAEQQRYLSRREAHHQSLHTFHGSGYEGCFHNGVDRLPVIDETHTELRRLCEMAADNVTPLIIDIIEKHMLLSRANDRLNARNVTEMLELVLKPPPSDPYGLPLLPIEDEEAEVEEADNAPQGLSLAELGEKITTTTLRVSNVRKERTSSAVVDAEVCALVESLATDLPDRDHFFFLDDSTSMAAHSDGVRAAFAALLRVTKALDPNKVELAFASNPSKVYRSRRTRKLTRLVDGLTYRRAPGMMELSFGRFVDRVIVPYLPLRWFGIDFHPWSRRPTSIYIFTDGNWGDDAKAACGVERPLKRLIEELKKRRLDKNQVTFHFVRFGEDEAGRRHLAHLDTFGRSDDWDVVDVKPVSSAVQDIIVGPISQENDDKNEEL